MSDITLQKAASKAYQAEIVARMLENYPHKLTDSERGICRLTFG